MKDLKKGISLITLVITIIVVIILAAAIILSMQNNNPIESSEKAKFMQNVGEYRSELNNFVANEMMKTQGKLNIKDIDATKTSGTYNNLKEKDIIESMLEEDLDKFEIQNGKLVYVGTNQKEKNWAESMGAIKIIEPEAPVLTSGMTPIKWNGNTGDPINTNTSDSDWYNYDQQKWANAQTADGSFWVWIPRYEYKITSGYHTSTAGTIDVKFIPVDQTTADSGYILHPAFTFGGTQLSGIWVAKFEATAREGVANTTAGDNVTTKHVKISPNVASWRYNYISTAYTVSRNMETDSIYGWGTSGSGIDTHLMKNVEWGAVAYLSRSTAYGIADGTEVWINPYWDSSNGIIKTGQAGTGSSVSSTTGTDNYNIGNGPFASTTHNVYGVYDMSGGAYEYVAAYVNNGNSNLATYGANLVSSDEKYKDVYTVGPNDDRETNYNANSGKVGDAVYETSSSYGGATSWFGDSYMPCSGSPFFVRGGYYGDGANAGLFYFNNTSGNGYGIYGFRPVVLVGGAL